MAEPEKVELSLADVQRVAAFAAACARRILPVFEELHQSDFRPRAATDAALAAMHAAGAAYLHPLYSPHQVKHILGSAVHLLLAQPEAVAAQIDWIHAQADTTVCTILRRFPAPTGGRTRFGALLAELDTELRR